MSVIAHSGLQLAYRSTGDGPPLVLVHGAGHDGRIWQPQVRELSRDFTVIAWDEPGAGGSSDVPPGFALRDYAHCLAAVIEDAAREPAHIAGLSWGGTVVLELHRHRPDLFATMVLADTYAGWKGSLPGAEVRARIRGVREMLAAPGPGPVLPDLFAGEPPARFRRLLDEIEANVRPASLRAQLEIMADADLRDALGSITVPVLLIWGDLDARSPLHVAEQMQAGIPHAELVVIEGCGHVSNLERPDAFNDALGRFCRSHPARGG